MPHSILPLVVILAFGNVEADTVQRIDLPGFEKVPTGPLTHKLWEVQRVGREMIQEQLHVECLNDATQAHSGTHFIRMSLPKETVGFEYVTIGQRHKLKADRDYEAIVWVRWPDGPEQAPADARTTHQPSAIVSFWVRHQDATGDYAGRDVWLFDRQWTQLTFRFRATHPDEKSLIYVSLLPNQTPRQTTVMVDDFTLMERPVAKDVARNTKERVVDGGFDKLDAGPIGTGTWSFRNIGGTKIAGKVIADQNAKYVQIAMQKNRTNYESAQLWQLIDLEQGVRYKVQCRMRWDNASKDATAPIVNYGMYHEPSNTWYGPVDQYLKQSSDWQTYEFIHVPPYTGSWKLYGQVNGWGNFGNGLTVSFDDFSCRVAK